MVAALNKITRVLVVDDSPTICTVLTTCIHSDPELRVVGTAGNGQEALRLLAQLRPDVVTMDVNMPVMDGFETIRHIMAYQPTPILILSSTIFQSGTNQPFEAMRLGALDVVDKAQYCLGDSPTSKQQDLTNRLKTLSRVRVIRHPLIKVQQRFVAPRLDTPRVPSSARLPVGQQRILAIASSTGGPQALLTVLKALPADLPCGVVIVQHISPGFDTGLATWLDSQCALTVKMGTAGALIEPGTAYVASCGAHMGVTPQGTIKLWDGPLCEFQKPSGTLLFQSVAAAYGDRAVAVILTGMGRDGADGMRDIRQAGGRAIAQDEVSCIVFGMPKAAIELGVVDYVRPLDQIPAAILAALNLRPKKEAAK